MRIAAAWTRVNSRGTPSGKIHACRKNNQSVCGVKTADPIQPIVNFYDTAKAANLDKLLDHPYICTKCVKSLGAQNR